MNKVLILANNSVGLYNFRYELIEELIKEKYEVYFSLPEDKDDYKVKLLISAGAKHIKTNINRRGMNPLEDIKLIRQYKNIIEQIKPSIILSYTIKPNIYGTYVAHKCNTPIILNVTGVGTSFNSIKTRYVVKNMYKYACHRASHVFFQNESNYKWFIDKKIALANKSSIIPGSGVNINKFKPLEPLNKDFNKVKFLFVSRIMKEKGIDLYIKAAKSINKKYNNTEFYILGPFEDYKYKEILENIEDDRICYLGVSDDVRNEIREVDCIIHPTYYPEGMSNVLLEAAASGKPIITSDISGCKEIVDDEINGYIIKERNSQELAKKIEMFLNLDHDEKEQMGIAGRRKIEKVFDRRRIIKAYLNKIKNILEIL